MEIYELGIDTDSFGQALGTQGLDDLLSDLRRGINARAVVSEANQRRASAQLAGACPIEGLEAELEMVVDGASYHWWGQRLGYECWDDDGFCREFKRDNASARVKTAVRHTTIVVANKYTPLEKLKGSKLNY